MSIEVDPMTLEGIGKDIKNVRLEKDGDACIGICGGEGVGKSDLEMQLGFGIDKNFDIEKNIAYSKDTHDVIRYRLLNDILKCSAFGIDEAITVANKRLFYMKGQILMNMTYTTCRDHNVASMFCMPDFFSFDKFWRDQRLNVWIQILRKGIGVIFSKDWNPFTTDKWNVRYNEKFVIDSLGRKKVHEIDLEKRIEILLKSKNCIGWFTWEPLKGSTKMFGSYTGDELWTRYRELKTSSQMSMGDLQSHLTGRAAMDHTQKIRLATMLYERGVPSIEIAQRAGTSPQTVNEWLRSMGARRVDKWNDSKINQHQVSNISI